MKVKFCAGWDTSENITKRLLEQFKTSDDDISNIEFVYDENYDIIVFNNYITEEPKKNSKSYIFFHEPSWSGSHQKNFSTYKDLTIFGHDKNNYDPSTDVIEIPAHLFYGGRGPSSDSSDFWNYNNLINYNFVKTKSISSVVSSLGNDNNEYPVGCIYKERVNLIKEILNKCNFIDVYGWGDKELLQKKDGIIDYKFSLCIENSNEKNYISEKFYDCILTNTIPIYFGCKNIKEFLPENGYFLIDDINDTDNIINQLNYISNNCDSLYEEMLPSLLKIKKKYFEELNLLKKINKLSNNFKKKMNKITLVTGLWDLGRDKLNEGWSRSFDHYLQKFEQLLQVEENLIIFGDEELEKFVKEKRTRTNTQFVLRKLDWFKQNDYYELIQKIRTKPEWYNQVGWLTDSTQAKLEMYNPLVMSKMFLLHDAKILDSFNSEYMFWIDAGLTNTIHPGYFTHDKVLDKVSKYYSKFSFVCFPYDANTEIHGFEYNKLNSIAGDKVKKVARAGFFGGPKESISNINSIYYGLLLSTLQEGYMGTEESIFSIMTYKHSDLINYFEIGYDGLMGTFFENLKNDNLEVKSEGKISVENTLDINKVGLYVITFNSPAQFETLIKSMLEYDSDFITKTKKFLLDNSSDLTTTPRYVELCEEYGFEHIKKDNLGICGGRQFVAEHFDKTDLDYMFWSEDDMFFQNRHGETCKNGFNRYTPNLFKKCLNIIKKEDFDFLKINFTEFYGDNSTQWSWYNVPQHVREQYWPEKTSLPVQGLDPNAPRTKFNNIKSYEGVPYADGEIYYCNWSHFLSKTGNKKMFLDTTWAHPFENTWMSHMYQLTKKDELKGGLLLMTPIEHNRFAHYDGSLRREN